MINLYAEMIEGNNLRELLSERGRNRVIKETLRTGLNYWHRVILPRKFTLSGQQQYGSVFARSSRKQKTGEPALVQTGEFRDRMLAPPLIRATFRSASIRFRWGRPSQSESKGNLSAYRNAYTADFEKTNPRHMESKTRNMIFSFMRGKSIKFEEARKQVLSKVTKKVYQRTSYNIKTRKQMHDGIAVVSASDRQEIIGVMQEFLTENLTTLGKANLR